MANPEHIELLNQGKGSWDKWRENNYQASPDLSEFDFSGLELTQYNFSLTNFNGSKLIGTNLNGADVSGATFHDALLQGAHFNGSRLCGAEFINADLREVDFGGANLSQTVLHNADLEKARLFETIFGNTDLSRVRNLDSCSHFSPCTLDFRTLNISGPLPLSFLRGCGLPESLIEHLPALLSQPFEFYKCFISFTETDDVFSERLYNDLQGRGVRCWRWKEDAKIGRTLMSSIDEAVRVYDKLIVVCSEASLKSPAVIREIERALQKEDNRIREGQDGEVLFPIRLDDYVFTEWNHYRKADVIQKNVGDFKNWNEPEIYQKMIDRLIRDLKAQ